MFMVIDMDQI